MTVEQAINLFEQLLAQYRGLPSQIDMLREAIKTLKTEMLPKNNKLSEKENADVLTKNANDNEVT